MVGVSVVAAPVPTKDTHMKKPVPRGAARDLYRMICALSGACERDCGVLRDGALVDSLELQAKRILRARRAMSSSTSSSTHRLSTSPVLSAKAIPSVTMTKLSKRRKLPAQDYDKADHLYGYDKSPMLSSKTFKSIEDVEGDKASIYMERADGSTSLIPSVKIGKIEPSKITPYVSGIAGDVVVNSVAVSHSRSPSASPIHMEHLSLDKPVARSSRQSLDFGASMASTVSSYSMQHYDLSDTEDSAPSSLTPSARYASARTSYDYDYPPARSCIRGSGSYGEERPVTPSSDLDDSEFESVPSRRKDSCYSEASTTSLSGRATPKKLRFEMDALSLYEKESSIKQVESGLVETLQSQVDLLLSENVKALSENARLTEMSQMSACEAEAQTMEKLQAVEQVKKHSEQLEELEQKYLDTKQRADAQEDFRREAEVAFQLELDAKAKLVTSLQNQVAMKDEEIGRLSKRVEDISGLFASKMRAQEGGPLSLTRSSSAGHPASSTNHTAETTSDEPEVVASLRESNMFLDMELERMRASLLEKDREICNLYMHLSTKKNLIDEITKKFVQHMEEAAAAAKANNSSVELPGGGLSPDGVRFDLDMFLFKNVVDKQRRMEELTAALGVMDREVESLEARVAEKERENTQLRENQEFLTRSLQTVNAQVCRVQADNELLDASVQEQQARIAALMSFLEEKDREVLQLSEQSDLRQSLVSEDKSSGRRSLRNSLFKGRSSVSSPAAKASSRASTAGATSTPRKSDATTIRSSLDWTDAHRSSVVMQRESEFTKTKRSSVFSDVFKDISAPISDDEESLFGASVSVVRSTRASYCASEINEDEDLFSELFAKA